MRAVMFDDYGDDTVLQLREIPAPLPGPGEVQVQVTVASLNPVDFKLRDGMLRWLRRPKLPAITGKDFAGRISALGAGVTGFQVGQRVFGSIDPMPGHGTCAETLVIGTGLIAATPESVSDETAACLPVAAGTALQALQTLARLHAGQKVLISGASGAVGASAVQWAHANGAHITAVCSAANTAYVRGLGAQVLVDRNAQDWSRLGSTFDVIFDAAGASTFWAQRHQLVPKGIYVNTMPNPGVAVASVLAGPLFGQRCVPFMLKVDVGLLTQLAELARQRVLQPRVARVIGLDGVALAQRDMKAGRVQGKVCVVMAPHPGTPTPT